MKSTVATDEEGTNKRTDDDEEDLTLFVEDSNTKEPSSIHRRLSHQLSSLQEAVVPKTPSGWTILITAIATTVTAYEIKLQTHLTHDPQVYAHPDNKIAQNLKLPQMKPSLWVGTRGALATADAYFSMGPQNRRRREILTMPSDGAQIAIDWEVPASMELHQVSYETIPVPVVLILHGINNDAGFGYVRRLMQSCTKQGWVAAGMNMRGCGIPLTTPRVYNGAYTGDLRSVVHILSRRVSQMCIVGNSLSANLVAKYLGEEGRNHSLPLSVKAGFTLGNPMAFDSRNTHAIASPIIAQGIKIEILKVFRNLLPMMKLDRYYYRESIYGMLRAWSLADLDRAACKAFCRNDGNVFRIGYQDARDYWKDASSYRYVPFVSVPLLQLTSADDFLVQKSFQHRMYCNLCNPNVTVIETACGGHLGWRESTGNFADKVLVEFFTSVLKEDDAKTMNSHRRSRL